MRIKRFEVVPLETEVHSARFCPYFKELLRQLCCIRLVKCQPMLFHFPSGKQTPASPPVWRLFYPRIKWVRADD